MDANKRELEKSVGLVGHLLCVSSAFLSVLCGEIYLPVIFRNSGSDNIFTLYRFASSSFEPGFFPTTT